MRGGEVKKISVERAAACIICGAGAASLGWLAMKYLFGALVPFAVAFAVALAVRRPARWLAVRTGLKYKMCSCLLLVLVLLLGGGVIFLLSRRLFAEGEKLVVWLGEGGAASVAERVLIWIDKLGQSTPGALGFELSEQTREGIKSALLGAVGDAAAAIGGKLPSAAMGVIGKLPNLFLSIVVTLAACFYLTFDFDSITSALGALLSPELREKMCRVREMAGAAIVKWLRVYALLSLLTFGILALGFILLGVDFALTAALLGTLVDILPLLGVGAFLLPWSIYCFAVGNVGQGVGLIGLYLAATVIRQLAEPRLVGGSLGIHPLLSLGSLYLGFRLFGFVGMVVLPILLSIVISVIRKSKKDTA